MDQFAGPVACVEANDAARGPVQMTQPGQPVAAQYPVHGRGHESEEPGDAGRAPPAPHTDLDDNPLGPRGNTPPRPQRTTRKFDHASFPTVRYRSANRYAVPYANLYRC